MRKILLTMSDTGGTQVEITGENGRFFTARDMDRALRAIKQQYRQAKREYRKRKIIEEYENERKEVKDGKEQDSRSNSSEERAAESSRSESTGQAESKPAESGAGVSENPSSKLAAAIAAKEQRKRAEKAGTGS